MAARFEYPLITVGGIVVMASLILLHSGLRRSGSLLEMIVFDTVLYLGMTVVADSPEITMFVAVAHVFILFHFVPARAAIASAIGFLTLGCVATGITLFMDSQQRNPGDSLLLAAVVAFLASVPAVWTQLKAGAEMHRLRIHQEQLSADKDRLLADKDRFVASVSHELRTPLTAVVGLAHTLADDPDGLTAEEKREFIGMIVQQGDEVAALVDDLLVAARAGSGHLALVVGEVDLVYELAAVIPDDIELISSAEQVTVVGDPVRVRQVLRNLVSNAARYGGENKRARIWLRGVMGVVAVEDDGPAIPDNSIDSIFTAYGRAHDRPGRTDSVGLGLTVSRQLARMMGGDVTYGHDGRWTSFQLSLPMSVMATSRAICAAPDEAMAAHGMKPR